VIGQIIFNPTSPKAIIGDEYDFSDDFMFKNHVIKGRLCDIRGDTAWPFRVKDETGLEQAFRYIRVNE
jgi:hypothetical protein